MEEWAIRAEHVCKEYQLGSFSATTLRDTLQRRKARRLHQEDPLRVIGSGKEEQGSFLALNDISFTIRKGERIGIIGENGAGKSTLLKLLCQITLPSSGDIWRKGRIASMLEVGTGFHPELTGRENIYMNGAILGMKKKEIDRKLEQIIEFSECAAFIDTPVKRYSSGMYVKLAFAVAASLDSEILIMDEVLAVGDMHFQKKCLFRLQEAASRQGRTVLMVSHNMYSIRELCTRTLVLSHGKLIFDGDTEEAIAAYMREEVRDFSREVRFTPFQHLRGCSGKATLTGVRLRHASGVFTQRECMEMEFLCTARQSLPCVRMMLVLFYADSTRVAKTESTDFSIEEGEHALSVRFPLTGLADGSYYMEASLLCRQAQAGQEKYDGVEHILNFRIENPDVYGVSHQEWKPQYWGHIMLQPLEVSHV